MSQQNTCPIWGTSAFEKLMVVDDQSRPAGGVIYNSLRAGGWYLITAHAAMGPRLNENLVKKNLSLWIWQENCKKQFNDSTPHEHLPKIDSQTIESKENLRYPNQLDRKKNVSIHILRHSQDGYRPDFGKVFRDGYRIEAKDDFILPLMAASFCLNKKELGKLLCDMADDKHLELSPDKNQVSIGLTNEGLKFAEEAAVEYAME